LFTTEGIVESQKSLFLEINLNKFFNALGGQVHDYTAKYKIRELGVIVGFGRQCYHYTNF